MKQTRKKSVKETMGLGLWFKLMAEALETYGVDSTSLFSSAGIDLGDLTDPWKMYPVSIRNQMWEKSVEATGDACFGLRAGACLRPSMLGHLGYSLLASSSLLAMFNRLERFMIVVTTDGHHINQELDEEYCIQVSMHGNSLREEALDAWLMLLVKLCRDMYSADFSPVRLDMQRQFSENDKHRMEAAFNCPINFSADQIALYVSKADMHAKLPGALRELALQHDRVLSDYLAKHQKSDVLTRVTVYITDLLPSGKCSKNEVAKLCHMSSRTLQNKLSQAGTSYYSTLDTVRKELALEYIRQPDHNLNEITYLLGFTDSSSFSRAFKRWTGISPSKFK